MNRLAVWGFRCFGDRQEARLAPLTLLVGENSTGKTSLLAMAKALRDAGAAGSVPDLNAAPYEFGSYDDMAHRRGARGGGPVDSFGGSLTIQTDRKGPPVVFSAAFAKSGAKFGKVPELIRRRYQSGGYWFEDVSRPAPGTVELGTPEARIKVGWTVRAPPIPSGIPPWVIFSILASSLRSNEKAKLSVLEGSSGEVRDRWDTIQEQLYGHFRAVEQGVMSGTLAGASVRSRPRRTYDAAPGLRTAEGESVPQRLADLSAGSDAEWKELRKKLVRFGEASDLFDEVEVRRLGGNDSDPFQIRVRKFGGTLKGPWRNLKDVGYGVSQALPILVEIMNGNPSRVFLLQQPEVHLHPQAQAALGSLFLEAAAEGRQLLVETHSDPLLDRIRMDIRDCKTTLRAEDVSLLYFERDGLGVRIHSLGFDEQGNVRGAPDSYRRFFLRETERRLEL